MPKIGERHGQASLYWHIPFCTHKCPYCHFYVLPHHPLLEKKLLDGLKLEWMWRKPLLQDRSITSIYFGGGTPSLLEPESIASILAMTPKAQEITLEVNPETVTLKRMRDFRQAGINRISIGIQSLDDDELQLLGRGHAAKKAIEAVHTTAEAGFDNITVDLMFELPKQTLDSWKRTLDEVVKLPIQHLSLYNLTFEPHTVFFKKRLELLPLLPNDETRLAMLEIAIQKLEEAGLHRYEISAFAKEGYPSKHNSGYWLARPFLGLGPSAFSYWEGKRFQNASSLQHWYKALEDGKSPVDFEEKLSSEGSFNELLAVQLRLLSGVDLEEFQKRHGAIPKTTETALQKLIEEGWLLADGDHLRLSKKGTLFYDTIAAEII